jgi:hypothetical protein
MVVKENIVSAVISKSIDDIITCGGVKLFQLRIKLITSGSRVLIEKLIVVTLEDVLGTLSCKPSNFRKRVRKVINKAK